MLNIGDLLKKDASLLPVLALMQDSLIDEKVPRMLMILDSCPSSMPVVAVRHGAPVGIRERF